jgi:malonyl-CoA O-methyltransferase
MLWAIFLAKLQMIDKNYRLVAQVYPCTLPQPLSDTLVLLHGWGSAGNSWQTLVPCLQDLTDIIALDLPGFGASEEISEFTLESVIELIAAQLPEKCVLMGWSLGGMLAVQLAARYPQKVSRIITLATNVKFVASRDYETAMPLAVNRQFNKSFAADAYAALKLFSGLLVQGDANERALLKKMRRFSEPEKINKNWSQALDLLAQLDNREAFASLTQQGLHLFAEKDALVPVACLQKLAKLNPQQQLHIIPNAAHAAHWGQPELAAQLIRNFLQLPALDKKQMAHSFSRAATTYDSVAGLQRDVGAELFKKTEPNSVADVVIDLGCGTGHFTPQLRMKFPQALIVGVDIAEGMLQFAQKSWGQEWQKQKGGQQKLGRGKRNQSHLMARDLEPETHSSLRDSGPIFSDPISPLAWLCSDAEHLSFADQSVDVIYSNFALQWCANLPRLFAELQRILKPDGQLIFTTLGPATLHELKTAWQQVDNRVHVNQFHERDLLLACLQQLGFIQIALEHKPAVMQFEHLSDLTRSLKALGAQNVNRGRAAGLTGRKKIQAFKAAYENFRSNNLLPATYDVFYVKAKNP